MTKLIKSILIVAFFSVFMFAGIISAEETTTNSQDNQTTTQQEEIITPEDLGVKEPTILPDNNFYFFKNWIRSIQLALTFNSIKKAELQLKFANEKIIETEKMVKLNKALGKIDNAFKNYQETMIEMATATEKIKEKAEKSPEVEKFLEKFTNQSALQQRILVKLESKVSTTTAQKIIEAREAHLEKFGEVMEKLENRSEKQVEILNNLKDKLEIDINTNSQQIQQFQQKIESIINKILIIPIDSNSTSSACAQVITYCTDPSTGECKEYPTPCSAPEPCTTCTKCSTNGDCPTFKCKTGASCPVYECLNGACTEKITSNTSQTSGCNNLWWFDNASKNCQQKQFCGMYMYFGLHTFDSEEECEKELLEAD